MFLLRCYLLSCTVNMECFWVYFVHLSRMDIPTILEWVLDAIDCQKLLQNNKL